MIVYQMLVQLNTDNAVILQKGVVQMNDSE